MRITAGSRESFLWKWNARGIAARTSSTYLFLVMKLEKLGLIFYCRYSAENSRKMSNENTVRVAKPLVFLSRYLSKSSQIPFSFLYLTLNLFCEEHKLPCSTKIRVMIQERGMRVKRSLEQSPGLSLARAHTFINTSSTTINSRET